MITKASNGLRKRFADSMDKDLFKLMMGKELETPEPWGIKEFLDNPKLRNRLKSLDKAELISLVKGSSPPYIAYHLLREYGQPNGQGDWRWNYHLDVDKNVLITIYITAKEAWNIDD